MKSEIYFKIVKTFGKDLSETDVSWIDGSLELNLFSLLRNNFEFSIIKVQKQSKVKSIDKR